MFLLYLPRGANMIWLFDLKKELMCYASVTPNKIQKPLHASSFVLKYNRLSHDVVDSM